MLFKAKAPLLKPISSINNTQNSNDTPILKRKRTQKICLKNIEGDTAGDNDDQDFYDEDDPLKIRRPLSNNSINIPKPIPGLGVVKFKKPFSVPTFKNGTRPIGSFRGGSQLGVTKRKLKQNIALYNPEDPDAVILYVPKKIEQDEATPKVQSTLLKEIINKDCNAEEEEVHVVVDPILGKVLRPHQVEGVKFLYDCTTGSKQPDAFGCIMADEMGLGKTLQCITLLWTLLKQSPKPGKPTIEKVVIACPSSLVKNWASELRKWLGERVHPFACDNKGTKEQTIRDLELFTNAKGRTVTAPVLIISYESLRGYIDILKDTEIGLMLCDEGHRLKNAESLTYKALNSLNAKRRVILSGTPIQNDLYEYYALISFAIPGLLGTESQFRKNFENPILRGRDSLATDKEQKASEEKLQELMTLCNRFIIRRTASILQKYLPTKYEHVVFCSMMPLQKKIYQSFIESKNVKDLLRKSETGDGATSAAVQPLEAITLLKKLVNHPSLLFKTENTSSSYSSRRSSSNNNGGNNQPQGGVNENVDMSLFPSDYDFGGCELGHSGKMLLLEKMLTKIKRETTDKVVLISNYTQTLDLFERLCRIKRWAQVRLDGSMSIAKRQKVVERFNDPNSPEFIFLLSSKAGGCGINLIGANRLVLFDPEWNPANDAQALARVWRDKQKKTCFIYRFIATGTIEEKIFQRQAHKTALSSCVVDEETDVERHFNSESLKQLFKYNENTLCDTHDTFQCKRCIKGKQVKGPGNSAGGTGAGAADTSTWNHYSKHESFKIYDKVLKETADGLVTFVFQNKSHDATD